MALARSRAHKAKDRQTNGTEQWVYGQMDKWRRKKIKCLSEKQKQMAVFIPRHLGEQSDGSARDAADESDRLRGILAG